jgi:hypothetical protein
MNTTPVLPAQLERIAALRTEEGVEGVAGMISSAEAKYAHTGDGDEDYDDDDRCRYVARAVIAHILGEG